MFAAAPIHLGMASVFGFLRQRMANIFYHLQMQTGGNYLAIHIGLLLNNPS